MTTEDVGVALNAYALTIVSGAGSYPVAEAFADLTAAHRAHVTHLYQREQAADAMDAMLADPEGQQLVANIHERQAR
jgi:hypothetical protein